MQSLPLLLTPLTYVLVGHNVDERFLARPKGAKLMNKYGVTVLEKGLPFLAHCALSLFISLALYPSISCGRGTRDRHFKINA